MKTQIIKIIPCLVAGFILSACVGAVNIPSEVAEKVIKTTEPEPIVLDPATILINRCIMDDNANDASCATAVKENSCITDPFGAACDLTFADYYKTAQANRISFCRDNYDFDFCQSAGDDIKNICLADPFDKLCFIVSASSYNNARETTCAEEIDSVRCETTISRVCFSDSLNVLCAGNENYYPAQKTACTNDNTDPRCESTIARVCDVDSLDAVCNGLTAYFPMQKTACESGNKNHAECRSTLTRICGADSLDVFCNGLTAYFPMQKTACKSGDKNRPECTPTLTRVCEADSLDVLCDGLSAYFPMQRIACENGDKNRAECIPTLTRICGADSLDVLCNGLSAYYPAQYSACENDNMNPKCNSTIERICGVDSLDVLCNGLATYYPAQKMACESGDKNRLECAPTIERVCGANTFDAICNGLTAFYSAKETTCADEPNSARCHRTLDRVCGVNAFGTLCQLSKLTLRHFPQKPNANFESISGNTPNGFCMTNDKAYPTCHGQIPSTINIKPLNNTNEGMTTYTGEINVVYINFGVIYRLTKNIGIEVNFDNSTLSYYGNIDGVYSKYLDMDGSFTDRGILTGTVNFYGSLEAPLIGLIGQDEAIGVFSTEQGKDSASSKFGGGFRVLRE